MLVFDYVKPMVSESNNLILPFAVHEFNLGV